MHSSSELPVDNREDFNLTSSVSETVERSFQEVNVKSSLNINDEIDMEENEDIGEDLDQFTGENTFQRYLSNKIAAKKSHLDLPNIQEKTKTVSYCHEKVQSFSDVVLDALWMIVQLFAHGPLAATIKRPPRHNWY